jgi:predicted dithiol-disulfide oxidoreductase (DUF899 family)
MEWSVPWASSENRELNRVPKGRDEGDAFQTWIRRHDEY